MQTLWDQIPFTGTIYSTHFFSDRDVEHAVMRFMNGMTSAHPLFPDMSLYCTMLMPEKSRLLQLARSQPEHLLTWTMLLETIKPKLLDAETTAMVQGLLRQGIMQNACMFLHHVLYIHDIPPNPEDTDMVEQFCARSSTMVSCSDDASTHYVPIRSRYGSADHPDIEGGP